MCETCGYSHDVDYPTLTEDQRLEADALHASATPRPWTAEVYAATRS